MLTVVNVSGIEEKIKPFKVIVYDCVCYVFFFFRIAVALHCSLMQWFENLRLSKTSTEINNSDLRNQFIDNSILWWPYIEVGIKQFDCWSENKSKRVNEIEKLQSKLLLIIQIDLFAVKIVESVRSSKFNITPYKYIKKKSNCRRPPSNKVKPFNCTHFFLSFFRSLSEINYLKNYRRNTFDATH